LGIDMIYFGTRQRWK